MSYDAFPYNAYAKRSLWKPREGGLIKVPDMSTDHILAALAKCQRDNWRTAFIPIFLEELANRGFKSTHPELFV